MQTIHHLKTRIQVSIHPDLVKTAERLMAVRQFSSFSGYLEALIREEMERRASALVSSNSVAHLADEIVETALAHASGPVPTKPKPGPVNYRPTPKARHRTKVKPGSKTQ
jgi:hypothetical protein